MKDVLQGAMLFISMLALAALAEAGEQSYGVQSQDGVSKGYYFTQRIK